MDCPSSCPHFMLSPYFAHTLPPLIFPLLLHYCFSILVYLVSHLLLVILIPTAHENSLAASTAAFWMAPRFTGYLCRPVHICSIVQFMLNIKGFVEFPPCWNCRQSFSYILELRGQLCLGNSSYSVLLNVEINPCLKFCGFSVERNN